jgi:hypothetical protein
MKMVKRLLLGSAAGLVAVGGTQAAELPVTAAPVQYVKICDLYGNGWYYIPGSDTCVKWGGFARVSTSWNSTGGGGPAYSGTQGAQDRTVSQFATQGRAQLQVDARTQTDYGTLRTYLSVNSTFADVTQTAALNRAFIQWAGFTVGRATSFSDTWNINEAYHQGQQNNADTAAAGVNVFAYTQELGNGMTLTMGADDVRRKPLLNLANIAAIRAGTEPANSFRGVEWPDLNLDFKVNQQWGYFALTGLAHDVSANYYNCTPSLQPPVGFIFTGAGPTISTCGRPNDKVGWAINGGVELNLDFISPGDHSGMAVRYGQGFSAIGGGQGLNSPSLFGKGDEVAVGWMTDGVFFGHCATNIKIPVGTFIGVGVSPGTPASAPICHADGGQIQLTTSWAISGGYEHYWAPNLRTAVYGGYSEIHYNDDAKQLWANSVCQAPGGSQTQGGVPGNIFTSSTIQAGFNSVGQSFCDPDWAFLQAGIRSRWSPAPAFFLDLDTGFIHVFSAFKGATAWLSNTNTSATALTTIQTTPIIGARPAAFYQLKDETSYYVGFRAQRIFNGAD